MEYRIYYKDRNHTAWDEWFIFSGDTIEQAQQDKERLEKNPDYYDVEIKQTEDEKWGDELEEIKE
jgi:hypothetical protein